MKVNAHSIVALRNQRRWSQEDLAAASGLSVRTIQRLESTASGSLDSLKAVSAAFDVDVRHIEDIRLKPRHLKLVAMPFAAFAAVSMIAAVLSGLAVRHGLLSEASGPNVVMTVMLASLVASVIVTGLKFYDEFGPFWKRWNL